MAVKHAEWWVLNSFVQGFFERLCGHDWVHASKPAVIWVGWVLRREEAGVSHKLGAECLVSEGTVLWHHAAMSAHVGHFFFCRYEPFRGRPAAFVFPPLEEDGVEAALTFES